MKHGAGHDAVDGVEDRPDSHRALAHIGAAPQLRPQRQQGEVIEQGGADPGGSEGGQQRGPGRAQGAGEGGDIGDDPRIDQPVDFHGLEAAQTVGAAIEFLLAVAEQQPVIAQQPGIGSQDHGDGKHHLPAQAVGRQFGQGLGRHVFGQFAIDIGNGHLAHRQGQRSLKMGFTHARQRIGEVDLGGGKRQGDGHAATRMTRGSARPIRCAAMATYSGLSSIPT